ncbi:MAG: MoxR family ATPase [Planctomycetota bacterium]|jgi:MoxR-like ATPase
MSDPNPDAARADAQRFRDTYESIRAEVSRRMVGQTDVIEGVLTALLAGGHVLLEGVPGLGKTMLVASLGEALKLSFSRIQFTPDMMPADVRGTSVLVETGSGGHELQFEQGPIVANLVLADEINRATPKTQSALLEAMQERQLTVGRRTIKLEEPFCVMATQNPVEQEGTYPLPEAQLDRFLFKLVVGYPEEGDYREILRRTTGESEVELASVSSAEAINEMRRTVRQVPVPEHAEDYAIRLVMGTQPGSAYAPELVNRYVSLGSSPRGAQALLLGAKVKALLAGRFAVATEDIAAVALPVLRHRVLLGFEGLSEGVTTDQVVDEVLSKLPVPQEAAG